MKNLLIGVLFFLVIILGAWLLFYKNAQAPSTTVQINPGASSEVPTPTPIATSSNPVVTSDIVVVNPTQGQIIKSPIVVSGRAKGSWYFEASAPVKVYDANNQLLGSGNITAQGDWMTTNFVPFTGTINFATSTTNTGKIVFMNDNPSGLPQNDKSYTVLVKFIQ